MRWRTSRARLLAAFAAALGVHLVLGLLVAHAPRRRPPEVPRRLAVELRTSAPRNRSGSPTEAPRATGREPAPPPPAARSEAGPKPLAPKMPPAADASDTASPPPKAPATEPSRTGDGRGDRGAGPGGPERGTKEWLAAEGLAREGAGPSLTLRDPLRSLSGPALLGAPPGGHRRTLWAFEMDTLIFPPLPLAGCALDSNLAPGECFYPFRKYGRPRVKLQAIY